MGRIFLYNPAMSNLVYGTIAVIMLIMWFSDNGEDDDDQGGGTMIPAYAPTQG